MHFKEIAKKIDKYPGYKGYTEKAIQVFYYRAIKSAEKHLKSKGLL
jgi:hypothetical protein